MKRTLLVVSLCLIASSSFAQKRAVRDAKNAMSKDISEARQLIKGALVDEETKDDPETWKVAGDIELQLFENELEKEQLKEFNKTGGNEDLMYEGLYNMYEPYMKADELGQLPDKKGKVKNKVRKDIVKAFRNNHKFFINGGVHYNNKHDFKKAADYFERYWVLPEHEMIKEISDSNPLLIPSDSVFQSIKYYAVLSAINGKDTERAIRLLNKINSEPYVSNEAYQESDTYELLADQYKQMGDSLGFIKSLESGAKQFPKNQYFTPNLINEYIKGGKIEEALAYIDQAIELNPDDNCELRSVKASLYMNLNDYEKSAEVYNAAIASTPDCANALEGLGVLYILQAQKTKDQALEAATRKEQAEIDKIATNYYQKAMPHLENYVRILKEKGADSSMIRSGLTKLQNVYYNLSLKDIDKSKELKAIEEELNL